MLPAFLITLREGIEIALILGIVLGILRKLGRQDLRPTIWAGAGVAVLVSLASAIGLRLAGAGFSGKTEMIFEGASMLLAAAVLTWMIFWMHRQAASLRPSLELETRSRLGASGRWPLFWLAFLAVLREGIELALLLVASSLVSDALPFLAGAVAGLATAALAGWLLFNGAHRLSLKYFFRVSNVLLILFAAGLAAHGVHEFVEAGWIPAGISPLYDLNSLLSETSLPGQLLKALFGYNGNPALSETLAYLAYFVAVGLGLKWASGGQRSVVSQGQTAAD